LSPMSFCWQDLSQLPPDADAAVTILDISHNHFRSLDSLAPLKQLKVLIADDNELDSQLRLPDLPHLETLSLNKNKISDLEQLCSELGRRAPRLEFLSLMGNPAAPDAIFQHISRLADAAAAADDADDFVDSATPDFDEDDFARYRLLVAHLLPSLRYLDSSLVTDRERLEARQRGRYLLKVRLAESDGPAGGEDGARQPYSPLPSLAAAQPDSVDKAAFGKSRYIYYGKHSEGNRFIRNNDL
ncbi:hypothetical protein BOX15_Mlig023296g1, partial [Macrostomum lignano]